MKEFEYVLPSFHFELPRIFNRVPFVACFNGEVEVGYGAHALMLGRWFIAYSG